MPAQAIPTDRDTKLRNAYTAKGLGDIKLYGNPFSSESTFVNNSKPYAPTGASPNWSTASSWSYSKFNESADYSGLPTVSKVARTLWAENANISSTDRLNAMKATMDILANRQAVTWYGSTLDAILTQGFNCVKDGNTNYNNPIFNIDLIDSWTEAYKLILSEDAIQAGGGTRSSLLLNKGYMFCYDTSMGLKFGAFYKGSTPSTSTPCTSISDITSNAKYFRNVNVLNNLLAAVTVGGTNYSTPRQNYGGVIFFSRDDDVVRYF